MAKRLGYLRRLGLIPVEWDDLHSQWKERERKVKDEGTKRLVQEVIDKTGFLPRSCNEPFLYGRMHALMANGLAPPSWEGLRFTHGDWTRQYALDRRKQRQLKNSRKNR